MIAALNEYGRKNGLSELAKGLNKTLKNYLFEGELLSPPRPWKPVGSDYLGDLKEEDLKILKERRTRYKQIQINLDRLCLELNLDHSEYAKAEQYALEALGI